MDISQLDIFNSDVDSLRQIMEDLDVLYIEEEAALGDVIDSLETWMQFASEAPATNDAAVPDAFSLARYTNINWLHMRRTPDDIVDYCSTVLDQLNLTHENMQRLVEEIYQ